jgi:alkylhydroperoxidase family enzyme
MALRIEIPADRDPVLFVWGEMVPGIGPAAAAFSGAVYESSTLPLREFEAARLRIAQINGCVLCMGWRTDRDGETVGDDLFDAVRDWRASPALSDRERLAAEYAERFANDHHGLDDEFWDRARGAFTDAELVELSMCIGSWIAFGRLNRVFGIDESCTLPAGAPAHRRG